MSDIGVRITGGTVISPSVAETPVSSTVAISGSVVSASVTETTVTVSVQTIPIVPVATNGSVVSVSANNVPVIAEASITGASFGGGDMTKAVYDPTSVSSDAFDMDNMVEGTTTKILTGTERTKLSGIETGAEVNNISDVNATDLTDGGDTTLHDHDGISENTSARHTQGTDTALGTMAADIDMNNAYQVVNLQAPGAAGEALRQTVNITEADLEQLTDGSDTTLHDHDGISENTSARHTQGTDTALGAVSAKNPPIDADKAMYRDSTAADALVTSTWAQVKAFLKTYFDTLYTGVGSGQYRQHTWVASSGGGWEFVSLDDEPVFNLADLE